MWGGVHRLFGSPKGVTGHDDPYTRQTNRLKKSNNIPRSKLMIPQTFAYISAEDDARSPTCRELTNGDGSL